jgi:hypothetical protein
VIARAAPRQGRGTADGRTRPHRRDHPLNTKEASMTYDEIKSAILKLSGAEQKRLVVEMIQLVLPVVCTDEACLKQIRSFVDDETMKQYRQQHMGNI